ncbi:MAG: DUF1574 domain-containing protein [Spirochaetia bacterium]|nr:DUF1574 domain-containing protein [Spirochaetia bacterium]
MKHKFLLSPFIIFLIIFLIEKLFLLSSVRDYTQNWKKFEPYIYESREDLFRQLESEYMTRKQKGESPGFVFGTSRSGEIAEKNFAASKGIYLYNFSTPLASYPQHYYWIKRITDSGIKPEYVIIEHDFIMFTETSMSYTLAYSLDIPFVIQHTDFLSSDESFQMEKPFLSDSKGFEYKFAERYFLKKMFALYRYPVDFRSFSQNRKEQHFGMTGIDINRAARELIQKSNRENLGGMENTFLLAEVPEDQIEKDVEDKIKKFNLYAYNPSKTQIVFFNKIIQLLAEKRIPVILFRPMLSGPFRKKISNPVPQLWNPEAMEKKIVQSVLDRHLSSHPEASIVIFEPEHDQRISCRKFMDATHLSAGCSGELIQSLKESIGRAIRNSR